MPKFVCTYKDLTIVMEPGSRTLVDNRLIAKRGRHIEFKNGEYKTEDPKEIEFIKSHRLFGRQVFEHEEKEYRVVEVSKKEKKSKKVKKSKK